jgi:Arm DNA-binding domain
VYAGIPPGEGAERGVYPETTLAKARDKCEKARDKLDNGIDPSVTKRLKKLSDKHAGENTFEAVALEWYETRMGEKSDSYRERTTRLLKNDLYPSLGKRTTPPSIQKTIETPQQFPPVFFWEISPYACRNV